MSASEHTAETAVNRDAKLMMGITLITVPTIQYGGYFLLQLFSGQIEGMTPSPLQTSMFRAGHAHAGVLVILSLIGQLVAEHARLGQAMRWAVRIALPLAAILMSAGFFLSVSFTPNHLSGWIALLFVGAALLAFGVLALGVGLINAARLNK